jgi:uncharacterized protein YegL
MAKRELHFIFLIDCSASMAMNAKMQSLNHAIGEAVPHMQEVAANNPTVDTVVRCIRFSTGASWHQSSPKLVSEYAWTNLQADLNGSTNMAAAVDLARQALRSLPTGRQYPPVLCLVSDGMPDSVSEYEKQVDELKKDNYGARAVRIAIGIGEEANSPQGSAVLQYFLGNIELKVLAANNAQDLVKMIRYVSTDVLRLASKPPSQTTTDPTNNKIDTSSSPPPNSTAPDINLPW